MLRERFQAIFDQYLADKEAFRNSPRPRTLNNVPSAEIVKEILPDELSLACGLESKYEFKGSIGLGNMADIPHICVFDTDITESAQEGYYIVYLFDSSMTKVYLSLNQGWTRYEREFGITMARTRIEQNSSLIKNFITPQKFSLGPVNLNSVDRLGQGYELGNICSKEYINGQVPSDKEIIDDLKHLVNIYMEIAGLIKLNIVDIPYRRTESGYQSQIQHSKPAFLKPGPIERKEKYRLGEREVWRRDPRIAIIALKNADYTCENDASHNTFIVREGSHAFMEGHHLIPVQFQDSFDFSLDVPENIISLCPNCHRAFHKSKLAAQKDMIERFYHLRKAYLASRGLNLKLKELIEYYHRTLDDEDIDVD